MEYTPKVVNREMEKIYEYYQSRVALYKDKGLDFQAYRKFLFDKAAPLENDILELGTGTGYTTVFLAKEGYKLISIDTDEEALKTTALRLAYDKVLSSVKFYIMDALNLEFGNGVFSHNNAISCHCFGIIGCSMECNSKSDNHFSFSKASSDISPST